MTSAVTVLPRRWDVATWKEFDKTTKYQGEHFSNRYKVDLTDLCLVPNDGTVGLHSQKLNLSRASQQDSAWFCYFNTVIYFNPEQYSWNFPKHDSILPHTMFYLQPWGNYILKWYVVKLTKLNWIFNKQFKHNFFTLYPLSVILAESSSTLTICTSACAVFDDMAWLQ